VVGVAWRRGCSCGVDMLLSYSDNGHAECIDIEMYIEYVYQHVPTYSIACDSPAGLR
jgi:hypothetical protein